MKACIVAPMMWEGRGIGSIFVCRDYVGSFSDKETALRLLNLSFNYVLDALPNITPDQLKRTWHIPSWKGRTDPDGRAMILNMFVHTAHHRAQCEVYLRAKGIKPPEYTF